jgi:hypothetical protein
MKTLEFTEYCANDEYLDVVLPSYVIRDPSVVEMFYNNNIEKINGDLFDAVNIALKEDLLQVPVFRLLVLTHYEIVLIVKRENFDNVLQKCLTYFEEKEEYEKCQTALNMIQNEG